MAETRSLVRKLTEVMAAVERIPKRGRNDFHKYDYATEADIAATVRKELADRHVMLIPSITGESRHSVGEKGSWLTVLEMEMEFFDGETGETIKKLWRGYGTDKEDKGGYKAMTGGEKYFLLKTFLMPTGDDPEADQPQSRGRRESRPQSQPARPAAPPAQPPATAKVVTPAERQRIIDTARASGFKDDEIKATLKREFGVESSAALLSSDVERICKLFQAGELVKA